MKVMKFTVAADLEAALNLYRQRYGEPTLIRMPADYWTRIKCPEKLHGVKCEPWPGRMVEVSSEI